MIELSPTTALMVYLGLALAAILSIWIFNHYSARKKVFLPEEKKLHVCEFCHFAYLDVTEKEITKCPRCTSFNRDKTEIK